MIDMTELEQFARITDDMYETYVEKNSTYGNSFSKLYECLGPIAGLVPLHSKLDRATDLVKGNVDDYELLEDTFKDLACYSIMNIIELNKRKK